MLSVIYAILPTFLLLMIGNIARRTGFLNEAFWQQADRATYFIFFPCLLVDRLSAAPFDWGSVGRLGTVILLLVVTMSAVSYLLKRWRGYGDADFTSYYQGIVRFNTFVAIGVVVAFPAAALDYLALAMAMYIPLVNVSSVAVFGAHTGQGWSWAGVSKSILTNPLVVGCAVGIAFNLMSFRLPSFAQPTVHLLSQLAMPMGLLAAGAGLRLKALNGLGFDVLLCSVIKLGLAPLLAYLISLLFGLEPLAMAVVVLMAGTSTAVSSYILARQLGGNAELMSGIITAEALLSLISLPIVLFLLLGLLHV